MGRLMTKEQEDNWSANGISFDPKKLHVECGPAGEFRNRVVIASLYGITHRDCFDTDNAFRRQKFRERFVHLTCVEDDQIHEAIDEAIIAKADAADSQSSTDMLKPEVVRLADVQPEQVEWLWPGRIAVGKVTLLAGDPGLGKSLATLDIAARVSTGKCWPDNRWEEQPVGGVVLLSAEDDLGDTIRPRLDSHGADVSRIVALKSIQGADVDGDYKRSFDLGRDLEHLRSAIGSVANCRLVVVDPISAYLGKTDSHKNSDVRSILLPLADLAAESRVAILAVSHLRKGEGAPIYRTMGSLAFVAAARSCWVVTKDSANPRRRLLLPTKINLAPDSQGLAFAIESHGPDGSPIVCWEAEPVTVSADEAMSPKRGPAPDVRQEAADWLREQLAAGAMPAKDVAELGDDAGFSKRTLQRAYRDMGGKPSREGFGGPIHWSLPIHATNRANDASGTLLGVNGDTWHEWENPLKEEDNKASSLVNTPYVPSSERQGTNGTNGDDVPF